MRRLFTFLLFLFTAQTQAQETLINETFETGWTADSNVIPDENEQGTPAANLKLQGGGAMDLHSLLLMMLKMGPTPQITLRK